jgi:hypothetical protein
MCSVPARIVRSARAKTGVAVASRAHRAINMNTDVFFMGFSFNRDR